MKTSTTAERIKQWMAEHGAKQVDILRRAELYYKFCGIRLNKNDLSQYVSGKTKPGHDKLYVLALAMDVSEPWLMGLDVPPERTSTPTLNADERTLQFVDIFRRLPPDKQELVIQLMSGLLVTQ